MRRLSALKALRSSHDTLLTFCALRWLWLLARGKREPLLLAHKSRNQIAMFKQISAFVLPHSPSRLFSLFYLFALRIKATFMARNSLLLNEMRLWINKYTLMPTNIHPHTHRDGAATRTYTDLLCETNHSYAALETFCVSFMRAWLPDRACMRVCVCVCVNTCVCVWRNVKREVTDRDFHEKFVYF